MCTQYVHELRKVHVCGAPVQLTSQQMCAHMRTCSNSSNNSGTARLDAGSRQLDCEPTASKRADNDNGYNRLFVARRDRCVHWPEL